MMLYNIGNNIFSHHYRFNDGICSIDQSLGSISNINILGHLVTKSFRVVFFFLMSFRVYLLTWYLSVKHCCLPEPSRRNETMGKYDIFQCRKCQFVGVWVRDKLQIVLGLGFYFGYSKVLSHTFLKIWWPLLSSLKIIYIVHHYSQIPNLWICLFSKRFVTAKSILGLFLAILRHVPVQSNEKLELPDVHIPGWG